MKDFVQSYFSNVESPIIKAFILLALYILAAKAADVFLDRIIRRLGKRTRSHLDDRIIDLVHRPVFYTVILFGSIHAITILNPSDTVFYYSKGLLSSMTVLIWAVCIVRVSNAVIESNVVKVVDVTGLSHEVIPLIENVWKVLIILGSLMVVLSIWKVNITPLIASAGIVGAAVAFAAKDTLANFFGGISVFLDKPYKIGDYVVLDGGERGEVVNIGIRSTRIKTRDDVLITIPNSIIANTKIINESAPIPKFRVRVPASVAYGSDIEQVEDILTHVALHNENVLKDPEPRVRLRAFGDSSLNFELLCWAKEPALRGSTIHELNKEIYKKFHDEGIVIPFPHRTVYLRNERDRDT